MDKRENLLWKIIIIIALFAVVFNGYKLYNMNNDYMSLLDDYEKSEIGTDKKLKEKVQKLEISLKEKQDFITDGSETKYYIAPENNPSRLDAVISFDGIESMGSRHFKIDNIYKSTRRNKYIATLVNTYGEIIYNMTVKDTIAGGEIIKIGDNFVVFKKDEEKFTYYLNDEENQNERNNVQRK